MPDHPKRLDPAYYPLILDVLDQGVFSVDADTCITSFNEVAERITGYRSDDVIGVRCADVFRSDLCDQICPLRLSIASRRPVKNRQILIRSRDGEKIPISVSTAPLLTHAGRLLGGVEVFRDLTHVEELRRRVDAQYRLSDIIGKSPAMRRIFDLLPLIAPSQSTVLVTGPSGTGKELIARTIHALGSRRASPFVALNCAAIPETLLESELFGYKKGAFTDARRDKPGRIAAAENGTLFLDEIGDLPRLTQVKLLRFLQDRVYEPLGSNTSVRANVHVIAATNRDLLQLVRAGTFREDLYFRLNVIQIEVPPLCERAEDVPLLVNHYVRIFRETTGKPIRGFSESAMAHLMAYPFPGNVRELENIVERAFILCQGDVIRSEQLPPSVAQCAAPAPVHQQAPAAEPAPRIEGAPGANSIEAAERLAIRAALERTGGNRTRAAAELGIHRTTLIRKLRQLGVVEATTLIRKLRQAGATAGGS